MSPLVIGVVVVSLAIGGAILLAVLASSWNQRDASLDAESAAPSPPRAPDTPAASAPLLPPIPAFPSPAHRLPPGVYMFGQLWRWDRARWSAELGDDCEPVVAIFDTPGLGTCAVTWDSIYRRTSARGSWDREHQSPGGRPRLSSGWGHPVHGLFAVGDRGTLLRSKGDGTWHRETLPELLRGVLSAVWGDDARLYLGTADGRVASSAWGSSGEWEIQQTPARDFLFDGACTPHGVYAVAQSGEVLLQPASLGLEPAAWAVEKKVPGPVRGLLADAAGRVWITSREGVLRSDRPGHWTAEPATTKDEMCALASSSTVAWAGGSRSVLMRRDASGQWTASPPGRSGTIQCVRVGADGELLVGTDFMLEVAEGGKGSEAEVLASVRSS